MDPHHQLEITIKGPAAAGKTALLKWLQAELANEGHRVFVNDDERANRRIPEDARLIKLHSVIHHRMEVLIKTEMG